jgi:hypothetical protein
MERETSREGAPSREMWRRVMVRGPIMEKVVKVLNSFAESDRADRAYYQSLTPHQRLEILWELNSRWPRSGDDDTAERLERVYRIVKFA